MDRLHLLRCIESAQTGGFTHYAAALRHLYQRQYGFESVTGAHFRRSMDWAKTAPRLRDHIATHKARQAGGTACQPSALPLLRASAISAR